MIIVWVSKRLLSESPKNWLGRYLHDRGLDLYKPFEQIENSRHHLEVGFQGTALPDRVVGIIRTVIGVVPITAPWAGVE